MALHESALEELGLAPLWVRRGSANALAAPGDAEGRARADVAHARGAVAAHAQANALPDVPDAARGGQTPDAAAIARGEAGAGIGSESGAATRRADVPLSDVAAPAQRAAPSESTSRSESPDAGRRPVAARPEPTAPAQPAARSMAQSTPPDDDFAWFDELPAQPSSRARALAPDHPAGFPSDDPGTESSSPPLASLDWDALAQRVAGCERCRLCEKRTQTVFGVGDREADWMLIGEAPGENEDRQGEPFVGQAGKLLDNMLHSLSLARGANVYIANVLKCRPPGNRNPEPEEVARCEPYLQRQVALVKPKLIVALGRFAAQSLLKTDASISSLRGRVHTYEGVPVIVTYHPAYLLRSLHDKAKAWQDLCLARETWRKAGANAGSVADAATRPVAD
ncbi:uracil-DNA glycosylase family protein [Paraburkholderia sp. SOS3]|jgi:uracil-DNA glycosylase family 4|uniref:uracil-DNA glycosylase family protein n=1 Tax=Paraburkholderia sp. SOS3 TaxID=1926494 RepID=UPI00094761F9|nr:uracil-DNA glycosylase family protein [Paraburkholderia sp. SOS3]APR35639.1 uracil-DNA glycosylase [Paraburkholderia sp. SOS3]